MLELLIENLYYLGFMETNKSLFNCFYKADFVELIYRIKRFIRV